MKDDRSSDTRWLAVFVGLFGLYCLFRAAICLYFLRDFDGSSNRLKYLSPDTALFVRHIHDTLTISTVVFAFVALVSGISAYGICRHRSWARKPWLLSCIALFIWFLFSSFLDLSSLPDYISGFALCIFSWYVLWYLPRKKLHLDSYDAVTDSHE